MRGRTDAHISPNAGRNESAVPGRTGPGTSSIPYFAQWGSGGSGVAWGRSGMESEGRKNLVDSVAYREIYSEQAFFCLTRDAFWGIFGRVEKWGCRRFRRRLALSWLASRCRKTWMPGTSPGMTVEESGAMEGTATGETPVRRNSRPEPAHRVVFIIAFPLPGTPPMWRTRSCMQPSSLPICGRHPPRAFGICRRKCRPARRVGKCRHSRPAFAGRECRPGSDLSTRCLCRRPAPAHRLPGYRCKLPFIDIPRRGAEDFGRIYGR